MSLPPINIVMDEVSDPEEVARARAQFAQAELNSEWLQAHAAEIYGQHRGRFITFPISKQKRPSAVWAVLPIPSLLKPSYTYNARPVSRLFSAADSRRLLIPLRLTSASSGATSWICSPQSSTDLPELFVCSASDITIRSYKIRREGLIASLENGLLRRESLDIIAALGRPRSRATRECKHHPKALTHRDNRNRQFRKRNGGMNYVLQ